MGKRREEHRELGEEFDPEIARQEACATPESCGTRENPDPGRQSLRHDEPFLVVPGGECIPLDGPLGIQEIRGDSYVLGHGYWERCHSPEQAQRRLRECVHQLAPHAIVAEALESARLPRT